LDAVAGMPGGEVIVVANGPREGRVALDVHSPNLRLIECPLQCTPAARNLGISEARNDVVLLTDDDCLMSRGWVDALKRRLLSDEVAVTTQVDVERRGPLTAFIDYQRYFHARPIDSATAQYPIGASVGIRRDRVPARFDEDMRAGDDVQFGAQVRDAGLRVAYVAEVPPLIHLLPERIETLTDRFRRYGPTNAHHLLRNNRPEFSIPYALPLYETLCSGRLATPRRFEELAHPGLREQFAAYDLMALGSTLAGYLDEAGKLLGRELIRLDDEALATGWRQIDARLRAHSSWAGEWDELPIHLRRWSEPRETQMPAFAGTIGQNLSQNAGLLVEAGPDRDLDRGGEQAKRNADQVWKAANALLEQLRTDDLELEIDLVAERLRAGGIAFRDGMQTIETIALGPVRPLEPNELL
jgi:Glycosyl transferase family 2